MQSVVATVTDAEFRINSTCPHNEPVRLRSSISAHLESAFFEMRSTERVKHPSRACRRPTPIAPSRCQCGLRAPLRRRMPGVSRALSILPLDRPRLHRHSRR